MNYYQSTLNDIKKLIDKKKYKEALLIINDEFNAPYVPKEFEIALKEILTSIKDPKENFNNKISQYNIEEYLFAKEKELQILAINFLKNSNIINYLDLIDLFMNDNNVDIDIKQILLILLIENKIDYKLKINFNNFKTIINPSLIKTFFDNDNIIKLIKIFEDKYTNNPSYFNLSLELLNLIYIKKMPNEININDIKEIYLYIENYISFNFENNKNINQLIFDKYNDLLFK